MKQPKTYVLMVSTVFPSTHRRAGQPTYFVGRIFAKHIDGHFDSTKYHKIHTCRANYPLWAERIKEVQAGRAIISLRIWSGTPYASKMIEVARIDHTDHVGIQRVQFRDINGIFTAIVDDHIILDDMFTLDRPSVCDLAHNDGLDILDFIDWYRHAPADEDYCIIHFTGFRYC